MSQIFSARNLRLQKYLRCLAAIILLAIPVSVAAQATLKWEVVNSFRFVNNQDSINELRRVYKELGNTPSAERLEKNLQNEHEAKVLKYREECRAKSTENERTQCFRQPEAHYAGWFSTLAENNYAKTCWDAEKLEFSKDRCSDYVHPKTHAVKIWINNLTLPPGARIEWVFNDQPIADPDWCDENKTCIVYPVPYNLKESYVGVKIDGVDSEIPRAEIQVEDKLIVGLGDSYASGEGNPDIPAYFDDARTDIDIVYKRLKNKKDFFFRREPKRAGDSEVAWLDRRCHRSMYSYQFKTALEFALSHPKQAVTYMSYACSGAVTDNIIDKNQGVKERMEKNEVLREKNQYKTILPQLDILKKVLDCPLNWQARSQKCAKHNQREIDYLLLSTGGNDIKFAAYVRYVITGISILVGKKPDETKTPGEIRKTIEKNYPALQKAITEAGGLNIKDCPEKNCRRILLTPYPNILQDETKTLCKADRGEFDIPFGPNRARENRITDVFKIVINNLMKFQKEEANVTGWTLVEGHKDRYAEHGFCARGDTTQNGEKFLMPTRSDNVWDQFPPSEYKAYESRKRWIRLPIDSKLTTDQVVKLGKFKLRILFIDVTSSVMHPTAEGNSVTADANFREISNIN